MPARIILRQLVVVEIDLQIPSALTGPENCAVPALQSEVDYVLIRLSLRSVASVHHADASVFQAILDREFVFTAVVAFKNSIYSRRRLDLWYSQTVPVRSGKRCLAEQGKSDQACNT